MNPRILVVSSANMDLVMRTERVPDGGETLTGTSYRYVPGGKGANAAVTVSRLAGDCVFCTRLGDDDNGRRLMSIYKENNIDTRFIGIDRNTPTGLAVIAVEEDSGQNRIIVYPGANNCIDSYDLDRAFCCYPDALFIQLEIPQETVIEAVAIANKRNIPVFMDAGPAKFDFPLEKLGPLEVFSPNETETLAYTDILPVGDESCLKACMKLLKRVKARYIVLKLGDRGCYVYDGTYRSLYQSHQVKAVDTTAAGDAFTAALTLEYLRCSEKNRIKRACEFGNIIGALTVSREGAMPSIPTVSEVKDFIAKREIGFDL